MMTDLNTLREQFRKITDLEYLKKELAKITAEIKKFDLHVKLTPQTLERIRALEKRFYDVRKRILALQKQVDTEVNKFKEVIYKTRTGAEARLRKVRLSMTSAKPVKRKATHRASAPAGKATPAARKTSAARRAQVHAKN